MVLRYPSSRSSQVSLVYKEGEPGGVKLSFIVSAASFRGVDSKGTLVNVDLDLVTRRNSESSRETRRD